MSLITIISRTSAIDDMPILADIIGASHDDNEIITTTNHGIIVEKDDEPSTANKQNKFDIISKGKNNWFGLSASEAMRHYRTLYSYGAILSCSYGVFLEDIFGIGEGIKWFEKPFLLSWLATDVDMSLGSLESESYQAGSHQMNYINQQSVNEMQVTFIETKNGDIAKSYEACKKLATPKDGTVNEPAKYAFALSVKLFGGRRDIKNPTLDKRYIVGVKDATISLQSTARGEIVKVQITFVKLAPYELVGV